MRVVNWQPFQDRMNGLTTMQHQMSHMLEDVFGDRNEESTPDIDWTPRMDIVEIDGKLEIQVELAGIAKDNVKAEIEDNILTISGEKWFDEESQNRRQHLNERKYGKFRRAFQIPEQFNREKIAANFDQGVLTLTLDRIEKEKPRLISIESE